MKAKTHLRLQVPQAVIGAVLNQDKVDEPPHNLYKYPARFAPSFAREVIKAFSAEGDLVLDPFCGGGTTLLEAMTSKRRAAGMDVSSLATFIARTKTTPISVHDRYALDAWLDCLESDEPALPPQSALFSPEEGKHYERNVPTEAKTFFAWAVERVVLLPKLRQQAFARLVLLSIGQWALDCKTSLSTPRELKSEFSARLRAATQSHCHFLSSAAQANGLPRHRLPPAGRRCHRDADRLPGGLLYDIPRPPGRSGRPGVC